MNKKVVLPLGLLILIGVGIYAINYLALFKRNTYEAPNIATKIPNIIAPSPTSVDYKLEAFVSNLNVPWGVVFTSEARALVTERPGRIRAIESGNLLDKPLITFSEVKAQSEEGLMGIEVDPNYKDNKYVYVCISYEVSGGSKDKVQRLVDKGDSLEKDKVLIDNIPAASVHAGCRIKFGPDGKLYVTTGDAANKSNPQDLGSLGGKILRINSDGSVPDDNPFKNAVYSYGHRNPQGLAWHPETKNLYATEHGPSGFDGPAGGDEINLIKKGANYGWPLVSHENTRNGTETPLKVFTPAEAPAGAAFYDGKVFPQFKNNFFFGALKGEGLMRVVISETDPSKIEKIEKLFKGELGRIRDVIEGPDGFIYFTTSNRDGRGTVRDGDDKIYRLIPN